MWSSEATTVVFVNGGSSNKHSWSEGATRFIANNFIFEFFIFKFVFKTKILWKRLVFAEIVFALSSFETIALCRNSSSRFLLVLGKKNRPNTAQTNNKCVIKISNSDCPILWLCYFVANRVEPCKQFISIEVFFPPSAFHFSMKTFSFATPVR